MAATARKPRQRAVRRRGKRAHRLWWLVSVISGTSRPLASREALTYRAARGIATYAGSQQGNLGDPHSEPTMLWPFNHFRKPRSPRRGTIEAIYGMIVTQAREPTFYRAMAVPDTVNGRFDLLLLHLWLGLRRVQWGAAGAGPSQAPFATFFTRL